ncbi:MULTISPECIES: helix-turn-helix domain-containing protein [Sphingobium]|jgi:transcriptional regulator with XRE-family HTH domain|uniref:Xre-family transcriptional regulator n=2 Tax=Sphingobium TaxID=165695 RepID=D4Z9C6_SPHIU|nr:MULTISPECIES: helix-turn-helix transcriptional regulator [Sphingobium]AMK26771.1 XRE family transcriptional regulator [Sphingobium sp. TKS]BAI99208.1 Xre-family transcriptional regulator [Sphingobium indicum UT26S]
MNQPALAGVESFAMLVGRNCRERRVQLEMSQTELSERSGVTASYLSRIENGRGNPTLELLDSIAGALGCHVVDLFRE